MAARQAPRRAASASTSGAHGTQTMPNPETGVDLARGRSAAAPEAARVVLMKAATRARTSWSAATRAGGGRSVAGKPWCAAIIRESDRRALRPAFNAARRAGTLSP